MLRFTIALCASILIAGCTGTREGGSPASQAPAAKKSEPTVRVRVAFTLDEMTIEPSGRYTASSGDESTDLDSNVPYTVSQSGGIVSVRNGANEQSITGNIVRLENLPDAKAELPGLQISGVPVGVGWWWESTDDRIYEGVVEFSVNTEGHLDVIVELPVEEYLRGVVPSEMGAESPEEALKAQAVAARSETMTALSERQYAGPNFDICADVDCQVFSGRGKRSAASDAAIRDTRGVIMAFDGTPIPAYYASNCGGFSEDVENVWPTRDRGIPCWSARLDGPGTAPDLTDEANMHAWIDASPGVFCNGAAHPDNPEWTKKSFRWEREFTTEEMTAFVAKTKDIGTVTAIEPIERGPSGRLVNVRFVGEKGTVDVGPELAIRRIWEPPLRSSGFIVDRDGDTFKIRGAGYGHGVGMCQTGAMGRALDGQTYRDILSHYYKDVEIIAMYE